MSASTTIDTHLKSATDEARVPGIIAMATDGDDILYEGAFGERTLGSRQPMTLDTVCWIHSMTKAITAACVMQIVEQGRIGLDDDCGRWVPSLANPRVLEGFDAAGKPILRPARGAITLRNLLTHTAGFVYDTWNADQNRYMQETRASRSASFIKPEDCLPLACDPGTRWEYGINIDWAGKVLEAITGNSLDAYMQKNLLQPLGMTSTGYLLRPEISARLSGVHTRLTDGGLAVAPFDPPQRPQDFLGGGGLYGTAGDYIRFMRMIMGAGTLDGVQVLKPETVALMGQNNMGDLAVRPLPGIRAELSFPMNFYPDMRKTWGLSFMINTEDVAGRRKAGSLTWAGLRNTYFWIDPKSRIAGTIMTQILPFADPTVLDIYDTFERDIYARAAG